ncbi:MAG: hypothetical protein ABSG59_17195 [Verrucomicrobiota bacterium]
MKKHAVILLGMLGLGISAAQAQTVIASWENSLDGWTVTDPNWTSVGFSTTVGVTAGSYSWELSPTSETYGLDALTGPSSTNLTALLANAASISLDVDVPTAGSFGWWMQCDMWVNQPGGLGSMSLDGNCYCQYPPGGGGTAVLTFPVSEQVRIAMASHPTLPTYLTLRFNGGGAGTLYFDNLGVTPQGLINSWENSPEGWTVTDSNWTSVGFSTNVGVTSGNYSWELSTTSETYGKDALTGPSSTALTALLGSAASISLDVDVPTAGSFGWWMQCDMWANQPGGLGSVSLDGNCYCQYPPGGGGTAVLTFPVSQAVRTALLSNPSLPTYLTLRFNGGGAGTLYFDDLQATLLPPTAAALWVREAWDDVPAEEFPATQTITNGPSSAGFAAAAPWVANPDESTADAKLMAFRPGFSENQPIGLPSSLDGTLGCLVQENNNFSFFPTSSTQGSFWSDDFITRQLAANNFINFQAKGEYWFSMTIGNSTSSGDSIYVVDPASGGGGIGFADGNNTNADFIAVGVTGNNIYFGPTNANAPFGEINATKSVYISQGTLGQAGNTNSTVYNPTNDPNYYGLYTGGDYTDSPFSQTNFLAGPYYINAFGTNSQGQVQGDGIVVLGHLKTLGGGAATLDAKFYYAEASATANNTLDVSTNNIVWDCSYSFNFGGTMTEMLVFENGQFPFYIYDFRAGTNFADVVGLDSGYISVSPEANTFTGFPINMTNWAAVAYLYGPLSYQWYQNGMLITNATSQNLSIATASTNDPSMPAGTDAGTFTTVVTDTSGTWGSVTTAPVVITVTHELPVQITSMQLIADQSTIQLTFDEPGLSGADVAANYTMSGDVVVTNAIAIDNGQSTLVQLQTTPQPVGSRLTLTINNITNQVGDVIAATTETFWTDIPKTGTVAQDFWVFPTSDGNYGYFNTFLPANPQPEILASMQGTSWDGPMSGVNVGDGTYFADRMYGWFIPPVTTNYVFFVSCDDGGRLSLSTNSDPANLCVIACESDWSQTNSWTNYSVQYNTGPHRGDGTATGVAPTNSGTEYGWDNSAAEGYTNAQGVFVVNPATADDQNRSDQFIVAYYDSSGLTGGPAGATNSWSAALTQVTDIVPTNPPPKLWPYTDTNGQALITLQAGQKYYIQLEHCQETGGYNECVTYKYAGAPDPFSPSPSIMTGSVIEALVPFTPSISIAETSGGPVITYEGVLLSGTSVLNITNPVPGAISSGGPAQYRPPAGQQAVFYKASEQ